MSTFKHIFFLILFAFLISPLDSNAQRSGNDEEPSRWFVGGNIGLQFGYVTLIDVSPIVGYHLSDRFAVGTGLTYKYYRIRNYFYDPYLSTHRHFRSHIYGGPLFARFYISRQIFAHTEYEFLRFRNEVYILNPAGQSYDRNYQNINVHSMFVGGGYRQYFGKGSAFEIMLLWNFNETPNSPYTNPVIRMGFSIGL